MTLSARSFYMIIERKIISYAYYQISDEYSYTTSDKGNVSILEVKADLTDIEEGSRMCFPEFKDRFSYITR